MKVLRHIRNWRENLKNISKPIRPTQLEILEPRLLLSGDSLSIITDQQTQFISSQSTAEIIQNENITIQTVDDMIVNSLGSQVLLTDNFNDGDYNGWILVQEGTNQGPMNWSAVTGVMVQSSNIYSPSTLGISRLGTYAYWQTGFDWTDYTTTVKMKSNDNDGIGIMLRYQDENNYYRFIWDKQRNSRALVKAQNGQFTILAEDSVPYITGQEYQVKILAQGSSLQVSIDGSSIFSVNDGTFSSGTIALYCWGDVGAYFDDIIVEGLDVANQIPVITSVTTSPSSILDTGTSQLKVIAYDPDSGPNPLTYRWSIPIGAGSLDNPNIANPIYTPPIVSGTQIFPLTIHVFDGLNITSQNINITVTDFQRIWQLLLEDFNDGDYNGWILVQEGTNQGPMNWSAVTGVMVQSSNIYSPSTLGISRLGTYAYWQTGFDWTDYTTTVKMKSNDNDGIGIMLRYQDENNYYRFIWDKQRNSRALVKAQNGQFTILAEDSVPYITGQEYQLEISVQGSTLQVSIDGSPVISVNDGTFSSGTIALYCWGDVGAYFDDITVTGLSGINQAPVITSVIASPSSISNTDTSQLRVIAYDPDIDPNPLTYKWSVPIGAGSLDNPNIANPIYTPPIVSGTQTFPLTVDVFDGLDTESYTVNITVTDSVSVIWQPPIGIPSPDFGINETYRMYDDPNNRNPNLTYHQNAEGGFYTHYIDNTHPNATDTNNPYGTTQKPRLTIPYSGLENKHHYLIPLQPGEIIEVHGIHNLETIRPDGWLDGYLFTGGGTKAQPAFVRGGNPNNPAVITTIEKDGYGNGLSGSYIILENFKFDNSALGINGSNIAVRNCEVFNIERVYGRAVTMSNVTDVVFYNNHVHHNWGTWPDGSKDMHNIAVTGDSHRVWIVDNYLHHASYMPDGTRMATGGDSIQVMGPKDQPSRLTHVYIGRNHMHTDTENAVDIKASQHVVISQNIAHDYGKAMISHEAAGETWFMFNEIYDSRVGIRPEETSSDSYIINNVIHDIDGPLYGKTGAYDVSIGAVATRAGYPVHIIGNTMYNITGGIIVPIGTTNHVILNNIISYQPQPWYLIGSDQSQAIAAADIDHNLFYQPTSIPGYAPDGVTRFKAGGIIYGLANFQAVYPTKNINSIEADPLFVDAANNDFHLQAGSPAIDSGTNGQQVQNIMQKYFNTFGVSIDVDIEGNPRPQGFAWDIGAYEDG